MTSVRQYLVNMFRKVCMICSVKGTPICTLRPWNRVRKKLSISSVTSKRRERQKEHVKKTSKCIKKSFKSEICSSCSGNPIYFWEFTNRVV